MSADVVTDELTMLLRMMAEQRWTFAYGYRGILTASPDLLPGCKRPKAPTR